MAFLSANTHPEIERLQIEHLRQISPGREPALVSGTNRLVRTLALAGLRQRYPDDSPRTTKAAPGRPDLGSRAGSRRPGARPGTRPMIVTEEMAALVPVVETLEALDVPYALGGSLASAVHGVARATMGAGLVADLPARALAEAGQG